MAACSAGGTKIINPSSSTQIPTRPAEERSQDTLKDREYQPKRDLEKDDNDAIPDEQDAFPLDPNESMDSDNDGIGNNQDTDDDNDAIPDEQDAFPLKPNKKSPLRYIPREKRES